MRLLRRISLQTRLCIPGRPLLNLSPIPKVVGVLVAHLRQISLHRDRMLEVTPLLGGSLHMPCLVVLCDPAEIYWESFRLTLRWAVGGFVPHAKHLNDTFFKLFGQIYLLSLYLFVLSDKTWLKSAGALVTLPHHSFH